MITLKDVARVAGFSEGAVSLALNNKPGVSDETRDRIAKVAEELGYTPNRVARGLATKKTHAIGLVVTDIENPFFGSVTKYITEYLRQHEYTAVLSVSEDSFELECDLVSRFVGNRVDGVIVIPTLLTLPKTVPYMRSLNSHRIPVVYCTSHYPDLEADCVMSDLEEGSYNLTRYLIGMGHREILLYTTQDLTVVPAVLRIAGFRRALEEAGIPFRDDLLVRCRYPDYYNGFTKTQEIIRAGKPDAIAAMNDFLALGITSALWGAGYSIPDDISVAGYDDVLFASILRYPLTTVRQNIAQICQETVHRLLDRLDGNDEEPRIIKLPTEVLVRDTTGRCAREATIPGDPAHR